MRPRRKRSGRGSARGLQGVRCRLQAAADFLEVVQKPGAEKEAVLTAAAELPAASAGAAEELPGDWKVVWSTLGGGGGAKSADKPPAVPLAALSFGALPPVGVHFLEAYNRVSATGKGEGMYELFQMFSLPEVPDVRAAMVLSGPWTTADAEKPGRASVHFQSVQLLPDNSSPEKLEACKQALQANGLGQALLPVPLRAPPTYIDVEFIDDNFRVHKGQSGATYVLTREAPGRIPFKCSGAAA
eukprot:TRINITY_DN37888_c0_g1_i1.p1 TRINITY_DN37888_c0_g1~~TRINITY_DN37888_c0_g1_i1.p1  ORF type:complete len:243 (+),score=45.52 TRINITY_DN37888_c0_g1_i1:101-829(+)